MFIFQTDLEYLLEERRDKFRGEALANDLNSRQAIPSTEYLSESDESSTASLNTIDHAILDHRRRKRRSIRRAKKKAFIDTIADYVDSDPVLGTVKIPKDTDSVPSLGDIVELNAVGDVDRHYSFFYPHVPKLSCKWKDKKFVFDIKKCCSCPKEQKNSEIIHSEKKYLKNNSILKQPGTDVKQAVKKVSLHGVVDDKQKGYESVGALDKCLLDFDVRLKSSKGAYGSDLKVVTVLKLFGFDRLNQVPESLIAAIDVESAFKTIYDKVKSKHTSILVSCDDVESLDLTKGSYSKLLTFVNDRALEKIDVFVKLAESIGMSMGIDSTMIFDAVVDVFGKIDIEAGQIQIESLFLFLEKLGMPLNHDGKVTIKFLFGQEKVCLKTFSKGLVVSTLVCNASMEGEFVNIDSLANVLLVSMPLVSEHTRNHMECLSNEKILDKSVWAKVINTIIELNQGIKNLLYNAKDNNFTTMPSHIMMKLDMTFLMLEAMISKELRYNWKEKTRDISIKSLDTEEINALIPAQVAGSSRENLVKAFLSYGKNLEWSLRDVQATMFDVLYYQHCLERDFSVIWGKLNSSIVRSRMEGFALFNPIDIDSKLMEDNDDYISPGSTPPIPKKKFKRGSSRDERLKEVDEFLQGVMEH